MTSAFIHTITVLRLVGIHVWKNTFNLILVNNIFKATSMFQYITFIENVPGEMIHDCIVYFCYGGATGSGEGDCNINNAERWNNDNMTSTANEPLVSRISLFVSLTAWCPYHRMTQVVNAYQPLCERGALGEALVPGSPTFVNPRITWVIRRANTYHNLLKKMFLMSHDLYDYQWYCSVVKTRIRYMSSQ